MSQEEHLVLEGIRVERPTMAEDNWLALTPVRVGDLGAVLGGDGWYGFSPFSWPP
jgi:hypothetical protein